MWRQRAWVQWLLECDQNTCFFYQKANNRRNKNRIEHLVRDDGQVCVNNNELEKMAVDFYEDLYKSEGTIGIKEVIFHVPRQVSTVMNAHLTADYIEEEVKTALFHFSRPKHLGRMVSRLISFRKIGNYVARVNKDCYLDSRREGFTAGDK
jgi:hypothetical protein